MRKLKGVSTKFFQFYQYVGVIACIGEVYSSIDRLDAREVKYSEAKKREIELPRIYNVEHLIS